MTRKKTFQIFQIRLEKTLNITDWMNTNTYPLIILFMENLHAKTETMTLSGSTSIPKVKTENDIPSIIIFAIFFIIFFIYFQGNGSWSARSKDQEDIKKYPLNSEAKKLTDRIRVLEHSLKSLSLKKRELENELHKTEMEGFVDEKSDPFDTEIKIEKLRMKIEEIGLAEEKKYDELAHTKQEIEELYFINNQA